MTVARVTNGHGRLVSFLSIFAQSRPKTGRLLAPKGRRERAADDGNAVTRRVHVVARADKSVAAIKATKSAALSFFVAIFFFSARNVIRRTVSAGRVCHKGRARSSRE